MGTSELSGFINTFGPCMRFSFNSVFYRWVIDPILSTGQKHIIHRLEKDDTVLDIACGTGALSIKMSEQADTVTGIDLSEEMIEFARRSASEKGISNIDFRNSDASDLSYYRTGTFSIAVLSMAIHQFDSVLAVDILRELKRIAGRVIIMDYMYPMHRGVSALAAKTVERLAAGDHYRNFRRYNELGGLDYFITEAGLILEDELYSSKIFRVTGCACRSK